MDRAKPYTAEQWEPDDARVSRPVLRERGVKLPRATRLVISIGGQKHWLWRAVDQNVCVLDEIVQTRRDTKAAKRLLVRLLKKQACHRSASSPTNCAHTERQNGT